MTQVVERARIAFVVAIALCAQLPRSATAYVRTTTETSGVPVQWNEQCVVVTIDERGSKDVSLPDIATTLARAVANWTTRTGKCGGLSLASRPAYKVLDVAADGLPAVIFRNDVWQRPGHAPHDPSAIGLTTVLYVNTPGQPGDGTILDADIELNNVNYTFSIDPTNPIARPGTQVADLENTLTHELGHVQGLAHTCWDHISMEPPLDNTGQPIPDCNDPDLPPAITNTTMFPYASMPDETSKRDLSPDDVAGVCEVYQPLAGKLACYPEIDGGACSAAPSQRRGEWPWAAIALVVIAAAAMRRRRCSRS
ncbi:MAG TPA: MYXO-CTERM sorting domain-containing protein [Polyangia bacterium]